MPIKSPERTRHSRVNSKTHKQRWARGLTAALFTLALSACDSGQPPEKTWKYAAQGVLSGDISLNSQRALLGSIHHGGSLWDTTKGERLFNWNHKQGEYSTLRAAAISGDGNVAVTAERGNVVVWDVNSGKSRAFWQAPDQVLAVSLSENGRYALMGLMNNTATYFDLAQGGGVYTFHHDAEIRGVDISEDGKWALTGSDDFSVKVWDLSNGKLKHTFTHENQVKTVAISANGRYGFSTAQREDSIIWDLRSGKPVHSLTFRNVNFTAARFSPREDKLLLGTFQGKVHLIDVKTGADQKQWRAKPRQIWGGASSKAIISVSFDASGKRVFALASDGIMAQFQ